MDYTRKPDFRRGEDENFCGAGEVFREKRLKESSEDYILPDYLPDIKKVAAVFPAATIKGRFLGSGTLEYEGEACYKVLYVAEDQTLRTAVFLTGFEDKIGNEELTEDCVELLTPLCEGVNVRLLNPRKLNIRSQNGADVAVYKRRCYMPVRCPYGGGRKQASMRNRRDGRNECALPAGNRTDSLGGSVL